MGGVPHAAALGHIPRHPRRLLAVERARRPGRARRARAQRHGHARGVQGGRLSGNQGPLFLFSRHILHLKLHFIAY